jgi:hypothetical protein
MFYKDGTLTDKLSKDTPDYLRPEIKELEPGGFAGYVSDNLIQKSQDKLVIFYNGKTANWLDIFIDGRWIESLQA